MKKISFLYFAVALFFCLFTTQSANGQKVL